LSAPRSKDLGTRFGEVGTDSDWAMIGGTNGKG
jgi:hypothetical protein